MSAGNDLPPVVPDRPVSIVVPTYREAANLPALAARTHARRAVRRRHRVGARSRRRRLARRQRGGRCEPRAHLAGTHGDAPRFAPGPVPVRALRHRPGPFRSAGGDGCGSLASSRTHSRPPARPRRRLRHGRRKPLCAGRASGRRVEPAAPDHLARRNLAGASPRHLRRSPVRVLRARAALAPRPAHPAPHWVQDSGSS